MNGTTLEVSHCGALPNPYFHPILGPDIRLRILFLNTLAYVLPLKGSCFVTNIARLAILLLYIF
jgi:hypothetical protein